MEYILHTGKLVIPVEIWHALELKCFVVTVLFSHRFVLHTKNETGLVIWIMFCPDQVGLSYFITQAWQGCSS